MANLTASSYEQLVNLINTAQSGDTITINSNLLTLGGELPVINKDLTIRSAGNTTISGAGNYRVFQVGSGRVTFENLTIANGLAEGAAGSGNNGIGGGLLITGGNVTLVNTNFTNNVARGGSGFSGGLGAPGGNGGIGQGGAVYVGGGSLRISTSSFTANSALPGSGGSGSPPGSVGSSEGGAIFVASGGTVITEGTPRYENNTSNGTSSNTAGAGPIQNFDPPLVQSIERLDTTPTALENVNYRVSFNQDVSGVDLSDFLVVAVPPSGAGEVLVTDAIPLSVTPVSGRVYDVVARAGNGRGSIQLQLDDNDSIVNSNQVPLGATGRDNGDFTGQRYFIDRTPPIANIVRKTPAAQRTAADFVTYTVQFSEPVNGIDTDASGGFRNFVVDQRGVSGAQVLSVTPNSGDPNQNTTYDVVVATGSDNGEINLRLIDDNTITSRQRGVPLRGNGTVDGDVIGPPYTLDKTPPQVASIQLRAPSPTRSGTVGFTVVFTQDVAGIDVNDFAPVVGGGLTGASIVSATKVDPTDNRTHNVIVNTGRGDGTLGLSVIDNDTIRNDLQVPLGGTGVGNGNFTSAQNYSVLKSPPVVSTINAGAANPTAAGTISYAVTFSQDVTGVDLSDFRLSESGGVNGAGLVSVSGGGNSYTVIANTGSGNGSLGLNLIDDDSIVNAVGTTLAGAGASNGNFTGQAFTINKTPPRVTAINRLQTTPNNSATVDFTVSFSEGVGGVDPTDFALVTQGVTGASIAAVTRVNDSFYSVSVNAGRGDGTLGLNLVDNDSIVNGLGLSLSGVGLNNGNFRGEAYSIDRAAPVADIVNVTPNVRRDKVNAITIRFNESVRGFDLGDLRLRREGRNVGLRGATLSSADGIAWTLGNLKKLTNTAGNYDLLLTAGGSGITDLAGNPLAANTNEQWRNLETVEACDPGVFRQGTSGANRINGTEDSDRLLGGGGNDTLRGLECRDRLNGGTGDDRLVGGEGRDELLGGRGADRIIYAGVNQAEALAGSVVNFLDRVKQFRFSEGDRFQLTFNNNLNNRDRPEALFNRGRVNGQSLQQAAQNTFRDRNPSARGNQALGSNEAVFMTWRAGTYLIVNDRNASFSATQDLITNVSGIQFKPGDSSRDTLRVTDYFV